MKKVLLLLLVISFGPAAFAQDTSTIEVAVDYTFLHAPSNYVIPSFNLNGAGGSVAYFFGKHFGIRADFQDYGAHSLNVSVPAESSNCFSPTPCQLSVSSNAFTYTAGPVLRFRIKRVQTFMDVMFGGAHDSNYAKIYTACFNQGECVNQSKQPNNNAFTWVLGGGIDLPFKDHISIRPVEVDYVPTRFGNSLLPGDLNRGRVQNNLRYLGGIVIKF
jgi:hypothetical protein